MNKQALETIAREVLLLDTLETRNSGEDFEEQAVWSIKKALEQAYQQGIKDTLKIVKTEVSEATGWVPAATDGFIKRVQSKIEPTHQKGE